MLFFLGNDDENLLVIEATVQNGGMVSHLKEQWQLWQGNWDTGEKMKNKGASHTTEHFFHRMCRGAGMGSRITWTLETQTQLIFVICGSYDLEGC